MSFASSARMTYVHELAQQSLGDGFYGFSVSLDCSRYGWQRSVVAARLANIGTSVGPVIVLERSVAVGRLN